ncbi:hypothetical protein GCM10023189_39720 [Nibrella saemangeumensis]|uniref:TonB-dependent receptor plug domain-containing protein n=2 Tax=Nibrella saemangeumensis TaxID=1084526 RepID=A0ABP8NB89_9BACT
MTEERVILLQTENTELEEVIVEATRANRSIAELPTRIEALTEEIDEASTMDPAKIAHLLTHSTGIQVQQTSATSNTANVRIQGLDGRYTQILKDGFPLYGGFSGSLSIMQIPPLDLRQVEYIKGSASTLYGGGAIGGLINLLSKTPNQEETLVHLNYSNVGARDANAFLSRRFGKWGVTVLTNFNLHNPFDADNDGYTDLPKLEKFNFNPRLFFYPDASTTIYLGGTFTRETRQGGDRAVLKADELTSGHFYRETNESTRSTTQFKFDRRLGQQQWLTVKNSLNFFDRSLAIIQNPDLDRASFSGRQVASFTELSYTYRPERHNLIVGLNYITDSFRENPVRHSRPRNEYHYTAGLFVNHLWDAARWLSLESGLRVDHNQNRSALGKGNPEWLTLPRLNALFKLSSKFSSRLGGGFGYRQPTVFNQEAELLGYQNVLPVDYSSAKAERSVGGNVDVTFRHPFSETVILNINQLFFYNRIQNPLQLMALPATGTLQFQNRNGYIESRGFETQMKLFVGSFTWFVGYTFTRANLLTGASREEVPLTPRHSVKGDLLFALPDKWRIGWDYELKSSQLLSSGRRVRPLFTSGLVVERTIRNFVLFVNFENFGDVRQTRYESLRSAPYNTPQFTEVWAPLDGFVWNTGIKLKL